MSNNEPTPSYARVILNHADVSLGADFHALTAAQVTVLLTWADAIKYRTPKRASGSRARCWHARLQRLAAKA